MDGQGGRGGRHLDADSGLNPRKCLPRWKIGRSTDEANDEVINLDATAWIWDEGTVLIVYFHSQTVPVFYGMTKLSSLIVIVSECNELIR